MNVLLLQLDGVIPNLALMRLAAHHRLNGDAVELRHVRRSVERGFWDSWDLVYASTIFERTRPLARRLLEVYPTAIVGGTGWDDKLTLEDIGVPERLGPDYSDFPAYPHSLGFTQRGCRLKCSFCKVPGKEPLLREAASVWDIWRGEPWPRNLLLLDNDFFGVPAWRQRIEEIRTGGFKVSWNQGFNVRLMGEEEAAAIASLPYYNGRFTRRCLYTAWDSRRDEERLFRNLAALVQHGVRPDDITVYMLVGYDHVRRQPRPALTVDDFYRQQRLREFGCRPYPMPFVKVRELTDFQRWVVKRIDTLVSWEEFQAAGCRPEKLGLKIDEPLFAE